MHMVDFTVVGEGDFPNEMLWFDGCHPFSMIDSKELFLSPCDPDRCRGIQLVAYGKTKDSTMPTIERWEMWGWKVVINVEKEI